MTLPARARELREAIEPLIAGKADWAPIPFAENVWWFWGGGRTFAINKGRQRVCACDTDARGSSERTAGFIKWQDAALACAAVNLFPEALAIIAEQAARIAEMEGVDG